MSVNPLDFSVEKNEYVACSIELLDELPSLGKYQTLKIECYVGFRVSEGRNGKRYLAAKSHTVKNVFSANRSSIVRFLYEDAGKRDVFHRFVQFFLVQEGEYEGVMEDQVKSVRVRYRTKNLRPLESLSEEVSVEIEAEIKNRGLLPSIYDPVKLLWYYWIKMNVAALAQQPQQPANIDEVIAELEKQIAEKERELAELRARLEELKRLKSVSGRIASIAIEVK